MLRGQRHDGIDVAQRCPQRVQRMTRTGHVRNREVEHPARELGPCERRVHGDGRRQRCDAHQQGSTGSGAGLLEALRRRRDLLQPRDRVLLGHWELDEQRGHAISEHELARSVAQVHRDHRADPAVRNLLAPRDQQAPQPARTDRERHVVERAPAGDRTPSRRRYSSALPRRALRARGRSRRARSACRASTTTLRDAVRAVIGTDRR